jgi:hypothetical protein
MNRRRVGMGAVTAAAVASGALVLSYIALGGGRYEPFDVADPCQVRPWRAPDGTAEIAEQAALSALDGAACTLGVSREEITRAVATEADLKSFASDRGLTEDEVENGRCPEWRRGLSPAPSCGSHPDQPASGGGPRRRPELFGPRAVTRLIGYAGVAIGLYATLARRTVLTRGATPAEIAGPAPGDEIILDPVSVSTMATSYNAPPEQIWPWLVQMGTGRGGWYSWDLIDNFGRPSAEAILPGHQSLAVGDLLPASRSGDRAFEVASIEHERHLVLRATWGSGVVVDSTWSLDLRPSADGGTRLVVRSRTTGRPRGLVQLMEWGLHEPGHLLMQTRQFTGLRVRAER